jgi:cytochrome P450
MDTEQVTDVRATAEVPPTGVCPVAHVRDIRSFAEVKNLMRSKSVSQWPDVMGNNWRAKDVNGAIQAREFLDGILAFVEGDEHARRRKLLNKLVKPESLDRIREEIVEPSVRRSMNDIVKPGPSGVYRCDLVELLDRIFLEFSAKLIGLFGVETEAGMNRLRACVHPIFEAANSCYFVDRDAITAAGLSAKNEFIEGFYKPSRDRYREMLARVEAGEMAEDDLPLTLMRFIVTETEPDYADEQLAIREAILFFVATTGTSTQAIVWTIKQLATFFEEHPEHYELRTDLPFLARAIQETVRLWAPFMEYQTRLVLSDVEYNGEVIPGGQELHLHLGAAGRDKSQYGPDASEFNPLREVEKGVPRYGVGFGTGSHQCLGLRIVLGNDGNGGSHVSLLKRLFEAGVKPDPDVEPTIMPMKLNDGDLEDLVNFISYPVLFTAYQPEETA